MKMKVQVVDTNAKNMNVHNEMSVRPPSTNIKHEEKPSEKAASQHKLLNKQEVKELTDKIQICLDSMSINLKFSTYGKNDERTSVTVTEKETGKEIRKIPPEELQQLYVKMYELSGMIFNHSM